MHQLIKMKRQSGTTAILDQQLSQQNSQGAWGKKQLELYQLMSSVLGELAKLSRKMSLPCPCNSHYTVFVLCFRKKKNGF